MKIIDNPKKEKAVTILVMVFIIMVIIVTSIIRDSNTKKLIKHGVITIGLVYDVSLTYRGYFDPHYTFTINGKQYKNDIDFIEILPRYQNNFINKTFPVIYFPEDPNINYLLLTPNSFEKYDKEFPDSLEWIRKYMRDDK